MDQRTEYSTPGIMDLVFVGFNSRVVAMHRETGQSSGNGNRPKAGVNWSV